TIAMFADPAMQVKEHELVVPPPHAFEPSVAAALNRLSDAIDEDQHSGDIEIVARAFLVAYNAHDGEYRKSGEPYIVHPIEVTRSLAIMRLDGETMAAGLLHDVVEDTDATFEQLEEIFG